MSHPTPLWDQVRAWTLETLEKAGVDTRIGPSLFATFHTAQLPGPDLLMEAAVGGGANSPAFGLANVATAMLPLMERPGIASSEAAGPETLTDRLNAEIALHNGTVMGPPIYGAWCRTPSG